jgi:16S rRNA (guanine966-N2)-methyltransferase
MSLTIIGGKFRNRVLKTLKNEETRPTTAIVRKAVFDMVQNEIDGAIFLDLFAGSGAMGLEALSRGAAAAYFVEKERKAFRCISDSIALLHVQESARPIFGEVKQALLDFAKKEKQFDLIYIDPPYAEYEKGIEALKIIDEHSLLTKGGKLFFEEGGAAQKMLATTSFKTLSLEKSRRYGNTILHCFKRLSSLDYIEFQ